MRRISIETFDTKKNQDLAAFRNTNIWLLNRLNTGLMIASFEQPCPTESQKKIASGLVLSACATGDNISRLLQPLSMASKDSLPLARTFYESCLQAAYCLTDHGELSNKVRLYSVYKAFKTQTKFFKLGKEQGLIKHPIQFDRSHPVVQTAIEEFEPDGGKKPRRCFSESRQEMIAAISKVSPAAAILLEGVELMGWDISSEIAHGSYFGFELANGGLTGTRGKEEQFEALSQSATNIIILCSDALAKLIEARFSGLDEAIHVSEAAKLFYQSEVPEMAEKIANLK